MSQMILRTCFEADKQEVSRDNHKKHLALLAKSYLLVCQRIHVLPLHSEHWCQMSASQNRPLNLGSSLGGYKQQWMKCPLPPPIGHPARIGNFVNLSFEPAWQTCSEDTKVEEEKKRVNWWHGYCVRCAVTDGILKFMAEEERGFARFGGLYGRSKIATICTLVET